MIIIDNSVLVPAIVTARKSLQARRIAAGDSQWIIPPLWKFEFTNVIATWIKTKVITFDEARAALAEAHTAVAGREVAVDQNQALRIATALSVSGYDAQYLALAEAFDARCVTDDAKLVKRSNGLAVLLDEFQPP